MPRVYIKTYGCQMNERDSEAVAAQLLAKGYALASSEATADVILLNTCSVRDAAEQRALNKMTTLSRQLRRKRPEVVLGFMGCMAQSRGQALIDQLPDVDLVLGTQKFHRAGEYLDELLAGRRERVVDVGIEAGSEGAIREHLLSGTGRKGAVTAYVSIMQGCNEYCTFVIVPYTRGSEVEPINRVYCRGTPGDGGGRGVGGDVAGAGCHELRSARDGRWRASRSGNCWKRWTRWRDWSGCDHVAASEGVWGRSGGGVGANFPSCSSERAHLPVQSWERPGVEVDASGYTCVAFRGPDWRSCVGFESELGVTIDL